MKQENPTHDPNLAHEATRDGDRLQPQYASERPSPHLRGDSATSVAHLQRILVELVDLTLQSKQAHWNVVGPNFRALHLQLDDLVASLRDFSDRCAERIAALGTPAVAAGDALFRESKIDPLPNTTLADREVAKLITERLVGVCTRIRECVGAEPDPVSADLMTQMLATLEQQLWMFEAQTVQS